MTTETSVTETADATALTADEAEAQVRKWIAAGLPAGKILFHEEANGVHIKLADAGGVAVWAEALGQDIRMCYGVFMTARCEPLNLPGWSFEVWCDAPVVLPEQRIAVREVSS